MLFIKFPITAVLQVTCITALSSCFAEQNSGQIAIEPPSSLSQNRAIDVDTLYVEITVNNTFVQTIRSGGDRQWLATVSLPVNITSTISVAWYQPWQCTDLLLATATQTVSVGNEDVTVDFPDGYDENHDSNGNGTNNLDELNNGTPPADCMSTATTSPMFPDMVAIPAGCFDMGSPADETDRDASREMLHNVCVNSFSIGKYEVTLAEFDKYTNANGLVAIRPVDNDRDGFPIREVSWTDANAYASWLGSQDGNTYRLPTEEEWEYATRAGTTTAFNTGNNITTEQARFASNDGPLKVGTFAPNAFGLYDTHGNVLEMTCSAFSADYSSANVCITTVAGVDKVVTRGGAHNYAKSIQLRSAARRDSIQPDEVKNSTGFRLVKE